MARGNWYGARGCNGSVLPKISKILRALAATYPLLRASRAVPTVHCNQGCQTLIELNQQEYGRRINAQTGI